MNRILLALFLSLIFSASGALAENVVGQLIGNWEGAGQVRPQGFGQAQKIRCKVTGVKNSELQVTFAGRCATSAGAGKFKIAIAQDSFGRRVAAKIRFSTSPDDVEFSGEIEGSYIVMHNNNAQGLGLRSIVSEIHLDLTENNTLIMQSLVTDVVNGEQSEALLLTFQRNN